MSDSSPPHYTNVKAVQNLIDSIVLSLLLQSFFSGAVSGYACYYTVLTLLL